MQQKEYTTKDWIVGILFVLWFFGSFAGFLLVAKAGMTWFAATVFGQIFLVIGIMVVVEGIKKKNLAPVFLIFVYVGLLACIIGVVGEFGGEATKEQMIGLLPTLAISIFLFMGILLFANAVMLAQNKKKCTVPLRAKCVEIKQKIGATETSGNQRRTRYVYCPVFEYTYNDRLYRVDNGMYTSMLSVAEGGNYNVMINPNKPEQYFEESEYVSNNSTSIIIGIIFVVCSVVGMVLVNIG